MAKCVTNLGESTTVTQTSKTKQTINVVNKMTCLLTSSLLTTKIQFQFSNEKNSISHSCLYEHGQLSDTLPRPQLANLICHLLNGQGLISCNPPVSWKIDGSFLGSISHVTGKTIFESTLPIRYFI